MKPGLCFGAASFVGVVAFTGCTALLGDFQTSEQGSSEAGMTQDVTPPLEGGATDQTIGDDGGSGDRMSGGDSGGLDGPSDGEASGDASNDAEGGGGDGGCGANELSCGGACVPNDSKNCGTCGNDCGGLAHVSGATMCTSGHCVLTAASCAPGFADCNGIAGDGCETDLSQTSHCGSCSTMCGGAAPVCAPLGDGGSAFACTSGCPAAMPTLCGGSCVDITADPQNCAMCSHACPAVTSGQPTCAASMCDFICNANFHKCASACADNASTNSCGSSCTPCPAGPLNGFATCNGVGCGVACNASFSLCSGACVNEKIDNANCGTCAKQCSSGVNCANGLCVVRDGQTALFASSASCSPNFIFAVQVTVPVAITVTALGSLIASVASPPGTYVMGLYMDNGANQPGVRLVQSAPATMVPGSQELAVAPTSIPAATYWVAASTGIESTSWHWGWDGAFNYFFLAYPYTGTMPSPMPAGSGSGTSFNFYVVGHE